MIEWFTSNSVKDIWYNDYLNCQQGLAESIKKYSNCFKHFYKKVNSNMRILVANTIRQFLSRLNSTITLLVYASILVNLQVTVNSVNIHTF